MASSACFDVEAAFAMWFAGARSRMAAWTLMARAALFLRNQAENPVGTGRNVAPGIADHVERAVGPLFHVADAHALGVVAQADELLAGHARALRRVAERQPDHLPAEERRHGGDEQVALPLGEEAAVIERHPRRC